MNGNPSKLIVRLKGIVLKFYSKFEGIYVLRTEIVNDHSHWVHESGLFAIWTYYEEGRPYEWIVGDLKDLGRENGVIITNDDVASPQLATTWNYYNIERKKFFASENIFVDLVPGTGFPLIRWFLGPRKMADFVSCFLSLSQS